MKALIAWTNRRTLVAYIGAATVLTAALTPLVHHSLYAPVELSTVVTTHEELYWSPVQVQIALERLAGEAALAELGQAEQPSLQERLYVVLSKYNILQGNSDVTRSLSSLPEYAEVVANLQSFLPEAQQQVSEASPRSLRRLREHIADLRPQIVKMAILGRAAELQVRLARTEQVERNRAEAFAAFLCGWAVILFAGWLLLLRVRSSEKALQQRHALLETERDAREAVAKAESARNTFLGKVSHEINSPLQAIITDVQLLSGRGVRESLATERIVDRLQKSLLQLRAQVSDLLDVSQVNSGQMSLHLGPVDVAAVARHVVNAHENAAALKGLTLSLHISDLQPVHSDQRRLLQILNNLVSNSVRYTETGAIDIEVSLAETPQLTLFMMVRDSGPGFSPEGLKRLYQPFMHGSKSRGGTGLGLAIVKGLVDQFGGRIELETQPGKGSTFTISLPVSLAQSSASRTFGPSFGAQNMLPYVLLVEDNPAIRASIADELADRGYYCHTAASVREALEYVSTTRYAVIVVDMELGDGIGVEVARAAKKSINRSTPLICCTAYPDLLETIGAEIFDALLGNPVDAGKLIRTIEDLLERVAS
jgi:signal transduction histidine kinase